MGIGCGGCDVISIVSTFLEMFTGITTGGMTGGVAGGIADGTCISAGLIGCHGWSSNRGAVVNKFWSSLGNVESVGVISPVVITVFPLVTGVWAVVVTGRVCWTIEMVGWAIGWGVVTSDGAEYSFISVVDVVVDSVVDVDGAAVVVVDEVGNGGRGVEDIGCMSDLVGAIEIKIMEDGVVVVGSSAGKYRAVVVLSKLYGIVTFSSLRMFAVRFSGIFGNGFTFSIVVFFGFMRTDPLVIVNGRRVDVFGTIFCFLCVMSASVLVTSKEP